jgi:hypothetical protein
MQAGGDANSSKKPIVSARLWAWDNDKADWAYIADAQTKFKDKFILMTCVPSDCGLISGQTAMVILDEWNAVDGKEYSRGRF